MVYEEPKFLRNYTSDKDSEDRLTNYNSVIMEKWSIADGKKVIVSCLTSFSSHLPSIPVLGLTSLLTTRQNLCKSSTQ